MKKIINFDKQLEFPSMIGEITSISLNHNLIFKDESNIEGNLIVKGTYKRTEASRLEEDFSFELPTEIILTEKLDLDTSKIEIDDFFYEIEKDDVITCHISILVEGMELIELDDNVELEHHETIISTIEKSEENRECDGDNTYEETYNNEDELVEQENTTEKIVEESEKEKMPDKEEIVAKETEDVGSLFTSLKDSEETYSTYSVYIVRKEETIESILSKFKISKEELEAYNDIKNIGIGSKIIIPVNE